MGRPRVLFLGDGVMLAARDRLARLLSEDGIDVVGPELGRGERTALAAGAAAWADQVEPDMACFGCAPWSSEDLLRSLKSGEGLDDFAPDPMSDFDRALIDAVPRLQRWCGRQMVYVTTPPVHEGRIRAATGDPDLGRRLNAWIAQYDQAAASLLGEFNVGVADLHHELARHDEEGLAEDGVSLSPEGIEIAARVIAKGIYGVIHP